MSNQVKEIATGETGWQAFARLVSHDWIVATAYDGANFGYVVNVKDGEPDERGSQHYKQVMETFAPTAREAAIKGLATLRPRES